MKNAYIKLSQKCALLAAVWVPGLAFGQASVINTVNIALTVYVQNSGTTSGDITTTLPPVRKTIKTSDVLTYLAEDTIGAPGFGPGTRLALVTTGPADGYFIVVDSQLNQVADVSDIMTFAAGPAVFSGKEDSFQNPAPALKGMELATITFDDTALGGNVQFSFQGLLTGTITLTGSTTKTQTQAATIASATGQGTYNGIPLVLTGTMTLKGSAKF